MLQDDEVALADRIACAARFLSDQDYTTALDTMARSLIANGKKENILQGLLLTGAFFFFAAHSKKPTQEAKKPLKQQPIHVINVHKYCKCRKTRLYTDNMQHSQAQGDISQFFISKCKKNRGMLMSVVMYTISVVMHTNSVDKHVTHVKNDKKRCRTMYSFRRSAIMKKKKKKKKF